ncbi:uncharacterized protein DS421_5g158510 [Arachis hypogaea]|nr:uncharacterized protein DS421_5g158510 [Arachis hypogaea]
MYCKRTCIIPRNSSCNKIFRENIHLNNMCGEPFQNSKKDNRQELRRHLSSSIRIRT